LPCRGQSGKRRALVDHETPVTLSLHLTRDRASHCGMIAYAVIGVVIVCLLIVQHALCRVSNRADELTAEHARRAASGDWPQ
jgi:hypothetical protein